MLTKETRKFFHHNNFHPDILDCDILASNHDDGVDKSCNDGFYDDNVSQTCTTSRMCGILASAALSLWSLPSSPPASSPPRFTWCWCWSPFCPLHVFLKIQIWALPYPPSGPQPTWWGSSCPSGATHPITPSFKTEVNASLGPDCLDMAGTVENTLSTGKGGSLMDLWKRLRARWMLQNCKIMTWTNKHLIARELFDQHALNIKEGLACLFSCHLTAQ